MYPRLDHPSERHRILTFIGSVYNRFGFPIRKPQTIARRELDQHTDDYVYTQAPVRGDRYLLVLYHQHATLINELLYMFQVKVRAPEAYFNGTVVEGRLTFDKTQGYILNIMDLAAYAGEHCTDRSFSDRHIVLSSTVIPNIQTLSQYPYVALSLRVHPWTAYPSSLSSTGVLRIKKQSKITVNPGATIQRWLKHPRIDLYHHKQQAFYCLQQALTLKKITLILMNVPQHLQDQTIHEFKAVNPTTLVYVRPRYDKTTPNHWYTIDRLIVSCV